MGIVVQGLAESFISRAVPGVLFAAGPQGGGGLYLGFSHLHSFFSSLLGFGISGYLLAAYVPDPATLSPEALVHAYDRSYQVWYYFAAIGLFSARSRCCCMRGLCAASTRVRPRAPDPLIVSQS